MKRLSTARLAETIPPDDEAKEAIKAFVAVLDDFLDLQDRQVRALEDIAACLREKRG